MKEFGAKPVETKSKLKVHPKWVKCNVLLIVALPYGSFCHNADKARDRTGIFLSSI